MRIHRKFVRIVLQNLADLLPRRTKSIRQVLQAQGKCLLRRMTALVPSLRRSTPYRGENPPWKSLKAQMTTSRNQMQSSQNWAKTMAAGLLKAHSQNITAPWKINTKCCRPRRTPLRQLEPRIRAASYRRSMRAPHRHMYSRPPFRADLERLATRKEQMMRRRRRSDEGRISRATIFKWRTSPPKKERQRTGRGRPHWWKKSSSRTPRTIWMNRKWRNQENNGIDIGIEIVFVGHKI